MPMTIWLESGSTCKATDLNESETGPMDAVTGSHQKGTYLEKQVSAEFFRLCRVHAYLQIYFGNLF